MPRCAWISLPGKGRGELRGLAGRGHPLPVPPRACPDLYLRVTAAHYSHSRARCSDVKSAGGHGATDGQGVSTPGPPEALRPPRPTGPHLLQCILVQFMQVESVDAFLGSHHQELICRFGYGVRGQSRPLVQAGESRAPASSCPWPTPGDRVNPRDGSMDPQGAAIEDLGEAGTHLGRRQETSKEAQGQWVQGRKVAGKTYVHLGGRREPMARRSLGGKGGVRADVTPWPPTSPVSP